MHMLRSLILLGNEIQDRPAELQSFQTAMTHQNVDKHRRLD